MVTTTRSEQIEPDSPDRADNSPARNLGKLPVSPMANVRKQPLARWREAWLDTGPGSDYAFILRQDSDGVLRMLDPREGFRTIATFTSYEDAVHWLSEDEYELAERQMPIDPPNTDEPVT
jgi:hypothetical protein